MLRLALRSRMASFSKCFMYSLKEGVSCIHSAQRSVYVNWVKLIQSLSIFTNFYSQFCQFFERGILKHPTLTVDVSTFPFSLIKKLALFILKLYS